MGGRNSARIDPTFDLLEADCLIRPEAEARIGEVNARSLLCPLLLLPGFDKTKSFDLWRFFLFLEPAQGCLTLQLACLDRGRFDQVLDRWLML